MSEIAPMSTLVADLARQITKLNHELDCARAALGQIAEEVAADVDTDFNDRPNQAARICNIIDRALGKIP